MGDFTRVGPELERALAGKYPCTRRLTGCVGRRVRVGESGICPACLSAAKGEQAPRPGRRRRLA